MRDPLLLDQGPEEEIEEREAFSFVSTLANLSFILLAVMAVGIPIAIGVVFSSILLPILVIGLVASTLVLSSWAGYREGLREGEMMAEEALESLLNSGHVVQANGGEMPTFYLEYEGLSLDESEVEWEDSQGFKGLIASEDDDEEGFEC